MSKHRVLCQAGKKSGLDEIQYAFVKGTGLLEWIWQTIPL